MGKGNRERARPSSPDRNAALGDIGGGIGGDIMALAFLLLIEAAKGARADLKAVMEDLKKANREKEGWRAASRRGNGLAAGVLTDTQRVECTALQLIDALEDLAMSDLRDELAAISEMSEMESLRLQMAMDRLSKLMSTLSNLLKKTSETADQITANLR